MEYLLAWRMAIAKDLLRREDRAVGDVAERVGDGTASTFVRHLADMLVCLRVVT